MCAALDQQELNNILDVGQTMQAVHTIAAKPDQINANARVSWCLYTHSDW